MSGIGQKYGLLVAGIIVALWLGQAWAIGIAPAPLSVNGSGNAPVTSSSASLAATANRHITNTTLFRVTFTSGSWHGELTAYRLGQGLSATNLLWRASAGIPAPGKRNIYTMSSAGFGIRFRWGLLNDQARSAIGSKKVLTYIRGNPGHTGAQADGFRNRVSLLGDIVHSTPAYAGDQGYGYAILPGVAGDSYRAYVLGKRTKPDLVLIGANDGMLHAFDADDGHERFAYVPRQLFSKLGALTDPDYAHRYYVDGSPVVADAWLNGAWATVVVTTLGRGGKGAFALDLTDPAMFDADSDVLWEISPATLANGYGAYLGEAMGAPAVVRLESGDWVALFGNGYNSGHGTAALIIVELATGVVLAVLDTGVGGDNGLGVPLAIDRNRNGSVDTVYAGDLKGNLWKFDLSADSAAGWTIAYSGKPLFTAVSDTGARQPITARPDAMAHPLGGVLVVFGTGRYLSAADASSTGQQSLYGIWDMQGADNDAVADEPVADMGALVEQTVRVRTLLAGRHVRVLTRHSIDYGTGSKQHRGWVVDLGRSGERIVHAVSIFDGKAIAVSTIPDAGGAGGDSALLVLNPLTGSQFRQPVLDANADGTFDAEDGLVINDGRVTVYPGIVDLDVGIAAIPLLLNRADGNQTVWVSGSEGGVARLGMRGFLETGRAAWVQRR